MMMLNLLVEILSTLSLLACLDLVRGASQGSTKSGKGCTKVLTAPSGDIFSPNYGPGQKYPGNLACKWTIKAPRRKKINLIFKDFLIEKTQSCRGDRLLLYDGQNATSQLVGKYCSAKPSPFTSSSNYIHMEFYSDRSLGFKGFYAFYSISLPTTDQPTTWKSRAKFKKTVLNKTATVGDTVHLECEVDGTPEPRITWSKDSQRLANDSNVVIVKSSFKSLLTIAKVHKIDAGRYSCRASNGLGLPVEEHGLLVVEDRKIPLITMMTKNQTVPVGEKIKLKCEAEGLFPMKISFREKDEVRQKSNCNQNAKPCQIKYTKRIVDDTVITCTVGNSAGEAARDVYFRVKGPPVITTAPENQTVQRGDALNFTCAAIGKNIRISWKKDNQVIRDGVHDSEGQSVLKLSAKQNATLACIVEGQDGKTSKIARILIIEEKKEPMKTRVKPTFSERPVNKTVNYNESTSVRCHATGYPTPHISWTLNGTKPKKTPALTSDGASILNLEPLEYSVIVTCIARNENQTIQASATITVKKSVPDVFNKKTEAEPTSDNIKLILGAGGGVLVLTGIVILLIVLRRKINLKIEKENQRPRVEASTTREEENLIPNPIFSVAGNVPVDTKPGVEMLHYPRESILHTEILENGSHIEVFLGRAADLPFSPGEFQVLVRALKDTEPSEEMKDDFDLEASLLANLAHPNVIRLMAVCIKTPPLCMIFEYSSYGYLDEYLQDCDQSDLNHTGKQNAPLARDSFTELTNVDRLSIAKQIASGMKYLTDKGYVHQELQARNCLVFKDMQVKIANLGLHWAKPDQNFFVMPPEEKRLFPVRWLPPEVVLYGEYTHSADVWSYAVLVWEVFSNGQLPYTGINDSDVVSYVRGGNVLPRPKLCPHEVYEVMKSCWEIAPLERPNFNSLYDSMTEFHAGVPV